MKNIVNCWLHSICTRYLRSSIVFYRVQPCRRCTGARPPNYIVGESLAPKNAARLSERSVHGSANMRWESGQIYIWQQQLFGTDISRLVTFECNELCQRLRASSAHMWKTDSDSDFCRLEDVFQARNAMSGGNKYNVCVCVCWGRGGRSEAAIEEEAKI